ncbi:hypothetical protein C8R43DRAFT_871631 [Mycena crocata]|nr:hypothetical protein C8R43DRAFT_871631 [Mycena crocata]
MIRALSRILGENFDIHWAPENSQIRCLAHVVNLVVQKLLAALEEAIDPDVEDYYLPNKDLPFHYDPADDADLAALENEQFQKEHEKTTDEDAEVPLMTALAPEFEDLTALGKASAIYKEELAPSGKPLCTLMVIRDVKHRWNYTEAMITRGRMLRKVCAINKWVIDREELRPLLLSSKEWELLEKLGDILQIFTQVTLQMSRAKTPTLPWVLPMYEHMLKNLKAHRDDDLLLASLRTAASAGLEKLETYYQKAKGCQFNVVATMLHPYLGYSWFKKMGPERANNAKVLFEFVFESYKKTHATLPVQTKKTPLAKTSSSFLDDVSMLDVEEDDSAPQESEFERFYVACRTRGRGEPNNPLAWWKVRASLTGVVFIH